MSTTTNRNAVFVWLRERCSEVTYTSGKRFSTHGVRIRFGGDLVYEMPMAVVDQGIGVVRDHLKKEIAARHEAAAEYYDLIATNTRNSIRQATRFLDL